MRPAVPIRPATLEDAPEVARLIRELGYPGEPAGTRAVLAELLASPRHLVAVAPTQDASLLGWVVAERRMTLEAGEGVELTGLVVDAEARRLGIGQALVAAAEAWARQQGFASLRVRSNVARAESHPFYEHLGFQRTKSQHVYLKPL